MATERKEVQVICARCLGHIGGVIAGNWVRWELCDLCRLNWWFRRWAWMKWFDRLIVRLVFGNKPVELAESGNGDGEQTG